MDHAMDNDAYGLWGLVVLNSVIIIGFAFSFFKPKTNKDWRSFGAFSAFIIALFVEMYGFPLSIFLLLGGSLLIIRAWLAMKEENDVEAEFGDEYRRWAAIRPGFIPRFSRPQQEASAK